MSGWVAGRLGFVWGGSERPAASKTLQGSRARFCLKSKTTNQQDANKRLGFELCERHLRLIQGTATGKITVSHISKSYNANAVY